MRSIFCLCVVMAGCAGTTPQDILEEFSRGVASANALYHAECDGREEDAACVDMRDHYNRIAEWLIKTNDQVAK